MNEHQRDGRFIFYDEKKPSFFLFYEMRDAFPLNVTHQGHIFIYTNYD